MNVAFGTLQLSDMKTDFSSKNCRAGKDLKVFSSLLPEKVFSIRSIGASDIIQIT